MQLHIVTAANRSLYLDEIKAMHRQRHVLYAEHMGWEDLRSSDGLDIDAFDTKHAVYFLALDADGELRGSSRLLPTWRPHMMTTLFRDYISAEPPVGPHVWEWSRYVPGLPGTDQHVVMATRIALHIGVLEFARRRDVEGFVSICEMGLVPRLHDLGWSPQPLGLPQRYPEGAAVALWMPVQDGMQEALYARLGRRTPFTLELSSALPGGAAAQSRRPIELALDASESRWEEAAATLKAIATRSPE